MEMSCEIEIKTEKMPKNIRHFNSLFEIKIEIIE
jgi:hypothetical protein